MIDERMMRLPVREKIVDWHMTSLVNTLEGHLGNCDEGMNGTERWKKKPTVFEKAVTFIAQRISGVFCFF